jgi:hypothetical protein
MYAHAQTTPVDIHDSWRTLHHKTKTILLPFISSRDRPYHRHLSVRSHLYIVCQLSTVNRSLFPPGGQSTQTNKHEWAVTRPPHSFKSSLMIANWQYINNIHMRHISVITASYHLSHVCAYCFTSQLFLYGAGEKSKTLQKICSCRLWRRIDGLINVWWVNQQFNSFYSP